jgi:hypothetical protein
MCFSSSEEGGKHETPEFFNSLYVLNHGDEAEHMSGSYLVTLTSLSVDSLAQHGPLSPSSSWFKTSQIKPSLYDHQIPSISLNLHGLTTKILVLNHSTQTKTHSYRVKNNTHKYPNILLRKKPLSREFWQNMAKHVPKQEAIPILACKSQHSQHKHRKIFSEKNSKFFTVTIGRPKNVTDISFECPNGIKGSFFSSDFCQRKRYFQMETNNYKFFLRVFIESFNYFNDLNHLDEIPIFLKIYRCFPSSEEGGKHRNPAFSNSFEDLNHLDEIPISLELHRCYHPSKEVGNHKRPGFVKSLNDLNYGDEAGNMSELYLVTLTSLSVDSLDQHESDTPSSLWFKPSPIKPSLYDHKIPPMAEMLKKPNGRNAHKNSPSEPSQPREGNETTSTNGNRNSSVGGKKPQPHTNLNQK